MRQRRSSRAPSVDVPPRDHQQPQEPAHRNISRAPLVVSAETMRAHRFGELAYLQAREAKPSNPPQGLSRSCRRMVTVSPGFFPMTLRTSALMGSLWVPSPMAMNELRNG